MPHYKYKLNVFNRLLLCEQITHVVPERKYGWNSRKKALQNPLIVILWIPVSWLLS